MSFNDEIYKEKYLKYKNKYLELKNQEGGIMYAKGEYIFFYDTSKYTLNGDESQLPISSKLSSAFNTFTDKIGDTAFYYKISDQIINGQLNINRNRSTTQVAKEKAQQTLRSQKIKSAKDACKSLDPTYAECNFQEKEVPDKNMIPVSEKYKVTSTRVRPKEFGVNSIKIIQKLNLSTNSFGAILVKNDGTIFNLYLPKDFSIFSKHLSVDQTENDP
jgi:hypothetical protein